MIDDYDLPPPREDPASEDTVWTEHNSDEQALLTQYGFVFNKWMRSWCHRDMVNDWRKSAYPRKEGGLWVASRSAPSREKGLVLETSPAFEEIAALLVWMKMEGWV